MSECWSALFDHVDDYDTACDRLDLDGSFRRSLLLQTRRYYPRALLTGLVSRNGDGIDAFVTELAWRDFYADVLHYQQKSVWRDLRNSLGRV